MNELPDNLLISIFEYLFEFDEYYKLLYNLNYFRLDLVSPRFKRIFHRFSNKLHSVDIMSSLNIILDICNHNFNLTRQPKKQKYYKKLTADVQKMFEYYSLLSINQIPQFKDLNS